MIFLNVLIHMTGVAKKQINGCMCWMTLPRCIQLPTKLVVQSTAKCKHIELIIVLYACADLIYAKMNSGGIVSPQHHLIYSWLFKQSYLERNLCKARFCPTQICAKLLCMFLLKILKIGDLILCMWNLAF